MLGGLGGSHVELRALTPRHFDVDFNDSSITTRRKNIYLVAHHTCRLLTIDTDQQ